MLDSDALTRFRVNHNHKQGQLDAYALISAYIFNHRRATEGQIATYAIKSRNVKMTDSDENYAAGWVSAINEILALYATDTSKPTIIKPRLILEAPQEAFNAWFPIRVAHLRTTYPLAYQITATDMPIKRYILQWLAWDLHLHIEHNKEDQPIVIPIPAWMQHFIGPDAPDANMSTYTYCSQNGITIPEYRKEYDPYETEWSGNREV